ncbi:MAG: VCBS repeat-containing protein [Verrucomicrobia bacterium]|nr:VCBS repeat-containing protein [Verrucomicrobiota bacterium]
MKTTLMLLIAKFALAAADAVAQPTITTQPKSQSASLGAKVTFNVRASGTSAFGYQWRYNDAAIPEATGISLVLTNIQLANAGGYSAVVTDALGSSATSQPAILDVDPTFTKITTGAIVTDREHSFACAWEDYDRDGFLDLLVGNGGILAADGAAQKNSLYHNSRNGTFEKITVGSLVNDLGPTLNLSWADFDNDGNPDVFVGNEGTASGWLYLNNGDSVFTRISRTNFAPNPTQGYGGVWADFNVDGWVDLFVARGGTYGFNHVLYQNNGAGALIGITNSLFKVRDYGISAAWSDYDSDGDLDLFVPNYRAQVNPAGNVLYRNDGRGIFADVSRGSGLDERLDTRGCAWADFDNDGDLDVFVANGDLYGNSFGPNQKSSLYRNNGNGAFTKIVEGALVTDLGIAMGGAWGDYDNDGLVDLFVVDATGNNRLYHNDGDGAFSRVTSGSLVNDGGQSQACAWGDYDNDGFLDLFVANQSNEPNFLYRNTGNSNAWIKIRCVGTVSNRSAIGAKVRLKATLRGKPVEQLRETSGGDGRSGQTLIAHFGLGDATSIDTLRIEWPSGIVQELRDVVPKQFLTVTEPARLQALGAGVLRIQSWKGMAFEVQASTNLEQWSPLTTVTNLTGTLEFMDPNAANHLQRYYRTVLR